MSTPTQTRIARSLAGAIDKRAEAIANRSTVQGGLVLEVDQSSRRVRVQLDDHSIEWLRVMDDAYVPMVGHTVVVPMNGDEPMGAWPPKGPDASVLANGSGNTAGTAQGENLGAEEAGTVLPWTAGTNTTLVQSSTQKRTGAFSFRVTRTGSTGDPTFTLPLADAPEALPGRTYNARMWVRPGSSLRSARIDIQFYDAANTLVQTYTSPNKAETAGTFVEVWMSGMAPASAVKWRPLIHGAVLGGCVVGEFHYIDDLELGEGIPHVATSGAQVWLFDADVEGWDSGTWSDIGAIMGGGVLVTNAGDGDIRSPQGVSGVTTVAGRPHSVSVFLMPMENNGTERTGYVSIDWWNGAAYLSSTNGAAVLITNGEYSQLLISDAIAPASATRASLRVNINSIGGGQHYRIDTALLTTVAIVRLRRSTDPTYVEADDDAIIEVRALSGGLSAIQMPAGLNNDTATAVPVVPGDFYRASCNYINDAATSAPRNVALIATWYDDVGAFLGFGRGATPITSTPGFERVSTTETFEVPPAAAFARLRIIALPAATEDTLYISKAVFQRVSLADAKIAPRGPVYALDQRSFVLGEALIGSGTFLSSEWVTIAKNPGVPVSVHCFLTASFTPGPAGGGGGFFFVSISLDGGATWVDGEVQFTESFTDVTTMAVAECETRNLPVGDILAVWWGIADADFSAVTVPHFKTTILPT